MWPLASARAVCATASGAVGLTMRVAEEALRKFANGGDHRIGVAGTLAMSAAALDAVTVELLDPRGGQLLGIFGGKFPTGEQGSERGDGGLLLFGQRGEETVREKVHVRVGDIERAPGRVHPSGLVVGGLNRKARDAGRERHLRQAGDVVDAQLLHHGLAIAADGLQAEIEHDGDLLAGFAFGHQAQHLQFARAKGRRAARSAGLDSRSPFWMRCSRRSETCGLR